MTEASNDEADPQTEEWTYALLAPEGMGPLLIFVCTLISSVSLPMTAVVSRSRRPYQLLRCAVLLGLWMGAFGMPALAQSGDEPAATVEMTNSLTFTPDTVRIQTGETVRWKNTSVIVHTVTADPEEATKDESVTLPDSASPFDSGTMDPETSFKHTFEVPGTYRYFCTPHEGTKMYGTVIVAPAE